MNIYSEDIEFLRELYYNNEVDLYFFHEKYQLSPAQLSRTISKFIEIELIILQDNNIVLTETGKKWIVLNRKNLFLNGKRKYWKEIPNNMVQKAININELYKPNRNKLDSEIFKNYEDGK